MDWGGGFLGTPLLICSEQLLLQGLKPFWYLPPRGRHRKAGVRNEECHSISDPKR